MRIAILRRAARASWSMDVYADLLVANLRKVRPNWTIIECSPEINSSQQNQAFWIAGCQKYYERYWRYPVRLSKLNADIFHVIDHSDGYLNICLKRQGKSSVITCHDLINLVKPETFSGRAKIPSISMMAWKIGIAGMRWADRTIAVSSHTKQDIVEHLGISDRNISVIPNAVDSSFRCLSDRVAEPSAHRTRQIFRQQQGINRETFCLLNVGSNNTRKNIVTILKVVSILKEKKIPIHFWKVGADFDTTQKQFIEQKKLDSCVSYLGQPDEQSLIEVYNAADCLLAPSTYEGFGLTILEAMACGTPVITANVTSMPEVAGDAAILVSPLDAEAIADNVARLCTQPEECQKLVDKGKARAKQFTWEKTAEQVALVYEQVWSEAKLSQKTPVKFDFSSSFNWFN